MPAQAAAAAQNAEPAAPKKPLIMEMKERPGISADYDSDPDLITLVFTVEKEGSAREIDLDVAEN